MHQKRTLIVTHSSPDSSVKLASVEAEDLFFASFIMVSFNGFAAGWVLEFWENTVSFLIKAFYFKESILDKFSTSQDIQTKQRQPNITTNA